jgi:acyl-CoA ligase (AMP-forming) (exosortase A-associated)
MVAAPAGIDAALMPTLVHHLLLEAAAAHPDRVALLLRDKTITYGALAGAAQRFAARLGALGVGRADRVAIYSDKRFESVAAMWGASIAGAVFVPVNPILKAEQVGHILNDCNVRVLVTTTSRLGGLKQALAMCPDLRAVVVMDGAGEAGEIPILGWDAEGPAPPAPPRVIDADMAAILYTSGSTGKPKGVVLSHRNIVAGAVSVAQYLELTEADRLLSVMPHSFDYGLNQLTTTFLAGASAVLLDHLFPRDIVRAVAEHRCTGLAAVPALWIQVSELEWPPSVREHLRYYTSTGGAMPRETLARLRALWPDAKPFLMYGLTEAFRSTYLPPAEADRRPDSIGKAIPNAEIMVVRPDGTLCDADEPGELVHRGVHVALGYWNDAKKTAERFKPAPGQNKGLVLTELAVWSGDTVRRDAEGFIYFIGRKDEMIKTTGYRVSPTEVEEVIYATGLVGEAAAFGVKHPRLGEAVVVVATPAPGAALAADALKAECLKRLPAYMAPQHVDIVEGPLPRNPNGKFDRKALAAERADLFA